LSWREVLAIAHEPQAQQAQLMGVKTRAPSAQDWLTAEHVAAALQLVAARLGKDSLTTREYRVERARLMAVDRARWLHGRWLLLPDDEQVIAVADSWDAALRDAGLKTTTERGPTSQPGAPTLVDLLERFHDAHYFQPSARELRAFARGNGMPYPSERAQRFGAAVAEWRRQRSEAGLPEPQVVTKVGGRGHKAPHYSADVAQPDPGSVAARSGRARTAPPPSHATSPSSPTASDPRSAATPTGPQPNPTAPLQQCPRSSPSAAGKRCAEAQRERAP
jgi:hypothetical protein